MKKVSIYSRLKKYGAPFYDPPMGRMSLEDTILLSLDYSTKKQHVVIMGIIPFVLALNSKELDLFKMITGIKSEKQRQLLGYFAEFANQFLPSKELQILSEILFIPDFKKVNLTGGKLTKFMMAVVDSRKNPTAKKWNIITIDEIEGHLVRYKKWHMHR